MSYIKNTHRALRVLILVYCQSDNAQYPYDTIRQATLTILLDSFLSLTCTCAGTQLTWSSVAQWLCCFPQRRSSSGHCSGCCQCTVGWRWWAGRGRAGSGKETSVWGSSQHCLPHRHVACKKVPLWLLISFFSTCRNVCLCAKWPRKAQVKLWYEL